MLALPPPTADVLDEDLQIIIATLETLSPEIGRLAPPSARALDGALTHLAEVRDALEQASHASPSRQLLFPLLEASA